MQFTIVTPSYNKGQYIQRTIESVLKQQSTRVSVEYIVRDNLSNDLTEKILNQYEQLKYPSMQIFRGKDRGQFDAINQGWSQGKGDIFAWLNADDVYLDNALQMVADFFEAHPKVMAVYGEAIYIDGDDRVLKPVTNIRDYSRDLLRSHDFITQPATFLRRGVFTEVGLLSDRYRYVFDWEYWLRISEKYEFVRVPFLLAGYRITGENLTTTGKFRRLREMIGLVYEYGGVSSLVAFLARLSKKYMFEEPEIPEV